MQTQPTVTFDDIPVDEQVREAALGHVAELEDFHDRITGCQVVVSQPHRHHRSGRLWSIRVEVVVPGADIVVNRDHPLDHAHEDVHVALRDAFLAARRRLEDVARRKRGDVKRHAGRARGRIVRLFPDRGYGFLETPDGREIYFHEHAVDAAGLREAAVGMSVHFTEEEGDRGPQASSVRLIRRGSGR
jgi:cold shock CspA family protein